MLSNLVLSLCQCQQTNTNNEIYTLSGVLLLIAMSVIELQHYILGFPEITIDLNGK